MTTSSHAKHGKADFDDIYDRPDPRAFYATLRSLSYEIPARAQPVFAGLVRHRRETTDRADTTVADLCTSYAVNPALMNHDITLTDVYDHYADLADAEPDVLREQDRAWYAERRCLDPVHVVGLDLASPALTYACDVGLLDEAVGENLEEVEPSMTTRAALADVDVVTVTGGIGYVTERTLGRVLDCSTTEPAPWFAGFALRWVGMDAIAERLAVDGLLLRRATEESFPQRRFADDQERTYVLAELERQGIDPEGREAEGRYHADLWVGLPAGVELPPDVLDAASHAAGG